MKAECVALAAFVLLSASLPAAEEAGKTRIMPKTVTIHLKNGETLTGTPVMTGPRATVVLVEGREITVPADTIERTETAESTASEHVNTADVSAVMVETYRVEPQKGELVIVAPDALAENTGETKKTTDSAAAPGPTPPAAPAPAGDDDDADDGVERLPETLLKPAPPAKKDENKPDLEPDQQ